MEKECGVTQISLKNAEKLIKQHGIPIQLDFQGNCKKADYFVTAYFENGYKHRFSGFSWGYAGEGPRGLNIFLQMCKSKRKQSDIPIDKQEKTHFSVRGEL